MKKEGRREPAQKKRRIQQHHQHLLESVSSKNECSNKNECLSARTMPVRNMLYSKNEFSKNESCSVKNSQ